MVRLKVGVATAWVALSLFVLLYSVLTPTSPETKDKGLFFVWAMLILTFPSGVVLSTIGALCEPLVSPDIKQALSTSALGLVMGWCAFVVCGYFQWFIVLPRLIRRLREWRTESVESVVPHNGP